MATKFGVVQAAVVGEIATIIGFGALAIPNDPNHGVAVEVTTTKYYRTRMGERHVYKVTTTVTGVSTY